MLGEWACRALLARRGVVGDALADIEELVAQGVYEGAFRGRRLAMPLLLT
jgi:hypothetical protein